MTELQRLKNKLTGEKDELAKEAKDQFDKLTNVASEPSVFRECF
ncbi:hypothetical protein [Listeria grandensis]|nr:hypothetical protein [Listeria grandensis]